MTRHTRYFLLGALLLLCILPFAAAAQGCDEAYKDIKSIQDIQELERRAGKYPECGGVYVVLGELTFQQELWLDAEKWYAKALEFFPDDTYLQDRHAEALRHKPIAMDDAASVDLDKEISKRGLGGTKGLPPFSVEVNFASGSASLASDDQAKLDQFAGLITQKFSGYKFEVQGHTDNVGAPAGNKSLSEKRAAAVKQYLVQKHGIDPSLLVVVGYGETRPLASNASGEGKARNRRVQFQGFK